MYALYKGSSVTSLPELWHVLCQNIQDLPLEVTEQRSHSQTVVQCAISITNSTTMPDHVCGCSCSTVADELSTLYPVDTRTI